MDPHDKIKKKRRERSPRFLQLLQPSRLRAERGPPGGAGSADPRHRPTHSSRAGGPPPPGMRIPDSRVAKAPRKTEEQKTEKAN
ncbi:hypothetical protein MDA_GLEAN10003208 [Myotis davidii]|uniref:Uncharacterized protein n=1 Tax=Myotis davidii TaxID=225400 RepID=L5MD03_MYODS|nr:hypothetical protein MDA_GLEAN10003208 [Myotis davidii]